MNAKKQMTTIAMIFLLIGLFALILLPSCKSNPKNAENYSGDMDSDNSSYEDQENLCIETFDTLLEPCKSDNYHCSEMVPSYYEMCECDTLWATCFFAAQIEYLECLIAGGSDYATRENHCHLNCTYHAHDQLVNMCPDDDCDCVYSVSNVYESCILGCDEISGY